MSLIDIAVSYGPLKMQGWHKLLMTQMKCDRRLYECTVQDDFLLEESPKSEKLPKPEKPNLIDLVPHNPAIQTVGENATLPTAINFDALDVHHVLKIDDVTAEFHGMKADDLILCGNAPIPETGSNLNIQNSFLQLLNITSKCPWKKLLLLLNQWSLPQLKLSNNLHLETLLLLNRKKKDQPHLKKRKKQCQE